MDARDAEDAEDAMMREMEREAFEPPVINPWRHAPSRDQIRYATDLCRTELEFPQRTIDGLPTMSGYEVSNLIRSLKIMRAQRLRRAPRSARWRLAPMTPRR